jgi:hypothetical protein
VRACGKAGRGSRGRVRRAAARGSRRSPLTYACFVLSPRGWSVLKDIKEIFLGRARGRVARGSSGGASIASARAPLSSRACARRAHLSCPPSRRRRRAALRSRWRRPAAPSDEAPPFGCTCAHRTAPRHGRRLAHARERAAGSTLGGAGVALRRLHSSCHQSATRRSQQRCTRVASATRVRASRPRRAREPPRRVLTPARPPPPLRRRAHRAAPRVAA